MPNPKLTKEEQLKYNNEMSVREANLTTVYDNSSYYRLMADIYEKFKERDLVIKYREKIINAKL